MKPLRCVGCPHTDCVYPFEECRDPHWKLDQEVEQEHPVTGPYKPGDIDLVEVLRREHDST